MITAFLDINYSFVKNSIFFSNLKLSYFNFIESSSYPGGLAITNHGSVLRKNLQSVAKFTHAHLFLILTTTFRKYRKRVYS